MMNEEQKAAARPKKKIRYIVTAILLLLIAIYAIFGAIFWKIGMPAFMFKYEKNDNGGITITDYYGPYLHVHIPDKIEELEVTEIGQKSFGYSLIPKSKYDEYICENICEVRLPDTVERIDEFAFSNCYRLTDVNIPGSLREIGGLAFHKTKIKEVELPEGVTRIEPLAFAYSGLLKKVTLPDSIEEIDFDAFFYCINLKEINVPDGLKKISSRTFYNTGLSKITLPDSIEEIDELAFAYCNDLKEINVPDELKRISSNAFDNTGLSDEQKQAFFDKAEEVTE